jgi:hypothetical protein
MLPRIMTGKLSCCRAKTGARGSIGAGLEPSFSAPFQEVRSRRLGLMALLSNIARLVLCFGMALRPVNTRLLSQTQGQDPLIVRTRRPCFWLSRRSLHRINIS